MRYCQICGAEIPSSRKSNNTKYCSGKCARYAESQQHMKRIATRANKINPKAHAIYNAYDCKCAICGWQATDEVISIKGRIQFSKGNAIHHIKASADGGSEDFTNLILLCPNHHKQADMGILPPEELTHYVKEVDTSPEARQALKDNAIMNVAAVIFG